MELFKGLFIYEVILMVLGSGFFIALCGLLFHQILKHEDYSKTLLFFILPIVMIGWPSIKKIIYEKGKVTIEKETSILYQTPGDSTTKDAIQLEIAKLESRAATDPSALVLIANANLALGDTVKARQTINKAIKINPNLVPAKDIQRRIGN